MDLYDFAEDYVSGGEPDFETFLLIHDVRRNYLLHVQQGETSSDVLDPDAIPAKTDAVEGIEWLPRILPKAKAKLRGELPPEMMFCCGGDRRFFKPTTSILRNSYGWFGRILKTMPRPSLG